MVSRPALPSQLKPPMEVHFASTLIDESLGMNFQLDLSLIGKPTRNDPKFSGQPQKNMADFTGLISRGKHDVFL
jgi:hypothetical protein